MRFDLKLNDKVFKSVHLIIFSKDRAAQLEALFSSILAFGQETLNKITVIYACSDKDYEYAYDVLKQDYTTINFVKETDFCNDVQKAVNEDFTFVLFLTDDDIIFRSIRKGVDNLLHLPYSVCCFSYRLGLNINYCYSNDIPNKLTNYEDRYTHITWNWTREKFDFGYPLSVTSHLFRQEEIAKWLDGLYFQSPNVMEGRLQIRLCGVEPRMASFKKSAIVGIPANRVNNDCPNRYGLTYPYSTKELNNLFLSGKKIDIYAMNFRKIIAAQQEIKYEFKKI